MPVILATLEAEIGRMVVPGQPRQGAHKIPWREQWCTLVIPVRVGSINRRITVQASLLIK
jgi:hypothetical protein